MSATSEKPMATDALMCDHCADAEGPDCYDCSGCAHRCECPCEECGVPQNRCLCCTGVATDVVTILIADCDEEDE